MNRNLFNQSEGHQPTKGKANPRSGVPLPETRHHEDEPRGARAGERTHLRARVRRARRGRRRRASTRQRGKWRVPRRRRRRGRHGGPGAPPSRRPLQRRRSPSCRWGVVARSWVRPRWPVRERSGGGEAAVGSRSQGLAVWGFPDGDGDGRILKKERKSSKHGSFIL